jgi:hypothetical protein
VNIYSSVNVYFFIIEKALYIVVYFLINIQIFLIDNQGLHFFFYIFDAACIFNFEQTKFLLKLKHLHFLSLQFFFYSVLILDVQNIFLMVFVCRFLFFDNRMLSIWISVLLGLKWFLLWLILSILLNYCPENTYCLNTAILLHFSHWLYNASIRFSWNVFSQYYPFLLLSLVRTLRILICWLSGVAFFFGEVFESRC